MQGRLAAAPVIEEDNATRAGINLHQSNRAQQFPFWKYPQDNASGSCAFAGCQLIAST